MSNSAGCLANAHVPLAHVAHLRKVDGAEENVVCEMVYVNVHILLCVRAGGHIWGRES